MKMEEIKLKFEQSPDARTIACVSGGEKYVIIRRPCSIMPLFDIQIPNNCAKLNNRNGFHTVLEAMIQCEHIERAWRASKSVPAYAPKTWTEPTMTNAETPSGPVFTYSGAMPAEPPESVWIPDEMRKVNIPVPSMSGKTPYSVREKTGDFELTITFATLAEMMDYVREQREDLPQ